MESTQTRFLAAVDAAQDRYVPGYESKDGDIKIEHLDGVPWWGAPLPRRFHRCWVQTNGWTGYFTNVQRCACGAARINDARSARWLNRNERRKESVRL